MDTQTTDPLPKRDAGGELLRLRWDHIDLETGITYLPSSKTLKVKTGLGQEIVMQRELIDLLNRLPKRLEYVFYRPDSNLCLRDHIYGPFKKVLRSLGINVRKYSLKEIRHTTGSQIRAIAEITGRKHASHTKTISKLF